MDSGPIDAAPPTSAEYDNVPRPQSPAATRHNDAASQAAVHRSRMGKDDLDSSFSDSLDGPVSPNSQDDIPLYHRVGATLGEISSEAEAIRQDGHLKAEAASDTGSAASEPFRMFKFTLYETSTRYWITGGDVLDKQFRLLRINRNSAPEQLSLFEDETILDRAQMNRLLATIDEGNRATGGLKKKYNFWGLLGFIRFTDAYYMLLITKRQQIAMIGGHYVYQIEATDLVPLTTGSSSRFARDRNVEESRFLGILGNLDLSRHFYFSYSYDITHSLQTNIIRQRQAAAEGKSPPPADFNAMCVWNHHLLQPALTALKHPFDWCLPITHGFIDQASLDIFGRSVWITVIGRRSRYFAGARFLKRGVNDAGYVANDVETEQIVAEKLTTSFHAPGPHLFANSTYTSYVQHRGSIPLYWTQETNNMTPKPDISMSLNDPFYESAALHFDNLFERYGCPIYVLNLIKARERQPRESKLLTEFADCIKCLNQSLPNDKKIYYRAYDMARAAKGRNSDVMRELEVIAREIVAKTGIFQNGHVGEAHTQVQNGAARTNCIDCLDRTNSAQFVIGKHALALQLKALGAFDKDEIEYDTDAVNLFTQMFHNHGDTVAMQYGGSHLVNTVATYRKLNHWQNSSRDAIENLKRYYNNSFLDSQRQDAYNLFLGNYVWAQGQPMLWDMTTDYYLHHSNPKLWNDRSKRNYFHWYTPEYLERRQLPPAPTWEPASVQVAADLSRRDGYWLESYRPTVISSLLKVYAFRLAFEPRYLPDRVFRDSRHFDMSPFVRRLESHRASIDSPEKKIQRKGVNFADQQESVPETINKTPTNGSRSRSLTIEELPSILREPTIEKNLRFAIEAQKPHVMLDKTQKHLWTLNQFCDQSLNPFVSESESREYERYVSHPLNLPLVTSDEVPSDANLEYLEYIHKAGEFASEEFANPEDDIWGMNEQDLQQFGEYVDERVDALTVQEEDGAKKRYKAYRQWLRGKSLFKQSKVDPEFIPMA